jgi:hypothetical protein
MSITQADGVSNDQAPPNRSASKAMGGRICGRHDGGVPPAFSNRVYVDDPIHVPAAGVLKRTSRAYTRTHAEGRYLSMKGEVYEAEPQKIAKHAASW